MDMKTFNKNTELISLLIPVRRVFSRVCSPKIFVLVLLFACSDTICKYKYCP